MFNEVFPLIAVLGELGNPEYVNLTDEEKANIDFINSCIYSNDKRINDAAFGIMLLLIEISNDPDKYAPEDIQMKKDVIYKGLTEEEINTMNKFLLSCINTMGIYNKKNIMQRKLKNERNDLNGKSK